MIEKRFTKIKTLLVLVFIVLAAIGMYMSYRAEYLQTLEIGEKYLEVFHTNMNYKYRIMLLNFLLIFVILFVENLIIKSGLKPFFLDEKKEMPKLPNKSLAFVLAGLISFIISPMISERMILFTNSIWTGVNDPIFNLDIGFFFFQKPFIELILTYIFMSLIAVTLYMVIYYIVTFNVYLTGVDRELLKKSKLVKQLKLNAFLIILTICGFVFLNTYNVLFEQSITLKDDLFTKLIGAGLTNTTIKVWGYRILTIAIIVSGILIIRNIDKGSFKKILYSVLIVPAYMVCLFVVMLLFSIVIANNNKFDKEKEYIGYNINYTKLVVDVKLFRILSKSAGP